MHDTSAAHFKIPVCSCRLSSPANTSGSARWGERQKCAVRSARTRQTRAAMFVSAVCSTCESLSKMRVATHTCPKNAATKLEPRFYSECRLRHLALDKPGRGSKSPLGRILSRSAQRFVSSARAHPCRRQIQYSYFVGLVFRMLQETNRNLCGPAAYHCLRTDPKEAACLHEVRACWQHLKRMRNATSILQCCIHTFPPVSVFAKETRSAGFVVITRQIQSLVLPVLAQVTLPPGDAAAPRRGINWGHLKNRKASLGCW
jgi:hypothetical protein